MTRRLLELLLLSSLSFSAAACGPSGERVDCAELLGSWRVDVDVTCEQLSTEIELARDVLAGHGIVKSTQFDSAFGDVYFHVQDTRSEVGEHVSKCIDTELPPPLSDPTECFAGFHSAFPYPRIELSHSRFGLAHELLHHWDFINLGVGSTRHMYWDKNGYMLASSNYRDRLYDMWRRQGYTPFKPGETPW